MPDIPLVITPDLTGVAVSCDTSFLEFLAPKAFPPGQPIELTLWPGEPEALRLAGRSVGSKLCPDQRFRVRMRFVNLSREARARLQQAFGA
jgi:hypothetical protein